MRPISISKNLRLKVPTVVLVGVGMGKRAWRGEVSGYPRKKWRDNSSLESLLYKTTVIIK